MTDVQKNLLLIEYLKNITSGNQTVNDQYRGLMYAVVKYLGADMPILYTTVSQSEKLYEEYLEDYASDDILRAYTDISNWFGRYSNDTDPVIRLANITNRILHKKTNEKCKIPRKAWGIREPEDPDKSIIIYDKYRVVPTGTELKDVANICNKLRVVIANAVKRSVFKEPDWLVVSYNCFDYTFFVDLRVEALTQNECDIFYETFGMNTVCIDGILLESTSRY